MNKLNFTFIILLLTCVAHSLIAQPHKCTGIYNYFGRDTLMKSDYNPYLEKDRVVINLSECLLSISRNGFITKISANEEKLVLATDLYIPDYLDSIKIFGILETGMSNLLKVKNVRLPKGLIAFGEPALQAQLIDSVVLPQSLRYIDSESFMGNNVFKDLKLHRPADMENHDFLYWRNGANSGLKDTIETGRAFQEYESYIAQYQYKKTGYYQLSTKDIIIYKGGRVGKCFYLGSDSIQLSRNMMGIKILEIEDEAFAYRNIKSFVFPDGIKTIGKKAFYDNKVLEVNIPESVVKIEKSAFEKNRISKINFSKNMNCIEEYSFAHNDIESLEIPGHIKKIKKGAFRCNKIKTLKLSNQLVFIDRLAFADNIITAIYLPSPAIKGKKFLYWQSFKRGKYNRKTKSYEEELVSICQPGDQMDLNLGYKAVFKED